MRLFDRFSRLRMLFLATVLLFLLPMPEAAMDLSGAWSGRASAAEVTIEGQVVSLPGSVWRATYTVTNWPGNYLGNYGFAVDVPLGGSYLSVTTAAGPSGWQVVKWQIDANIPASGKLDARTHSANPSTMGPFYLDFTWSGAGTPPLPDDFIVYNTSFSVIDTGRVVNVPEPSAAASTAATLLTLCALAGWRSRRARVEHSDACRHPASILALAFLLVGLTGGFTPIVAKAAITHTEFVGSYQLDYSIGNTQGVRISQTTVEYPVTLKVKNLGSDGRAFTLSATGNAQTAILNGSAQFSGLGANQSDYYYSLKIRQDRRYLFNTSNINWGIEYVLQPTLRIINDLESRSGMDDYNGLLWVRIGPNDQLGGSAGNTYERLTPYDSLTNDYIHLMDSLPANYTGSSYRDFDVSGYSPEYWVMIQAGWWDWESSGGPFGGCNCWRKHATEVLNCAGQQGPYKWNYIHVWGHTSGIETIYVSNFLPHYSWQGTSFCQ